MLNIPPGIGPLSGSDYRSLKLYRAQMLRNENDQAAVPIEGLTRFLDPRIVGAVRGINEEAISRSGLMVQLTMQRTRGVDGKTYLWLARKVLSGRGEGSSGLTFDYLR